MTEPTLNIDLASVLAKLLGEWKPPGDREPMGTEKAREVITAWIQGERAMGVSEHARILAEMAQETGDHHFEAAAFLAHEAFHLMMNEITNLKIVRIDPNAN